MENRNYRISGKGALLLYNGGFVEKEAMEEAEERKQEELRDSVIETNKSVKSVNRLFWATLALAFVSAVGTIGTFILETRRTEPQTTLQAPLQSRRDTSKKDQLPSSSLSASPLNSKLKPQK